MEIEERQIMPGTVFNVGMGVFEFQPYLPRSLSQLWSLRKVGCEAIAGRNKTKGLDSVCLRASGCPQEDRNVPGGFIYPAPNQLYRMIARSISH